MPTIAIPLGEGKRYIFIRTIRCVIICNLCHNYRYIPVGKIYILYIQWSYTSRLTLYIQLSFFKAYIIELHSGQGEVDIKAGTAKRERK